jgi:hypothetical protein
MFALSSLAANAGVVINEILYHAPNDMEDLEYIELYNSSDQAVDLSGWQFTKDFRHKFPPNSKIEAKGFLVICRNQDRFKESYGFTAGGSFEQPLSNGGERVELANVSGEKVDSVNYKDSLPWPAGADGHSASLERISPFASGDLPQNWAASPLSDDGLKAAGTPGKQNANFSANLPPIVTNVRFTPADPAPDQSVTVEADIKDTDGVGGVSLRYRLAGSGFEKEEASAPMARISENRFSGMIPGQKANQLIRFRIQAADQKGARRLFPAEHEPRPALSCYVQDRLELGKIPFGLVINVGEAEFKAAEKHRKNPNRGGFSEESQLRFMAKMGLEAGMDLPSVWFELAVNQPLGFESAQKLQRVFSAKLADRDKLIEKTVDAPDLKEKMAGLSGVVKSFNTEFNEAIKPILTAEQNKKLSDWQQKQPASGGAAMQWGPEAILKQFVKLEAAFFRVSTSPDLTELQLDKLRTIFRSALQERGELAGAAKEVMSGAGDWGQLQEKLAVLNEGILKRLKPILTVEQDRQLARWRRENSSPMPGQSAPKESQYPQGRSAFVYINPQTKRTELFDFVNVTERNAGYKVHFHKDRPLQRMAAINLIFEYNDRFVLAEPLAYELYRRAGNATELTDFVRLSIDGQVVGYHLLVEQPNRAFLQRNKIKDDGDLYKILWYERGVVGQHEKKTNLQTGHDDIVQLVELLEKTKGDEQWAVIKKHFDVEQVINYFAVNTCLSHWDGFFNNYFAYHDTSGSGKWQMYPWDQDKTWGFHDGIRDGSVFYDMPLTFGMEGDIPPGWPKDKPPPRTFTGGSTWWRPGGHFSRPLLANAQFRKHYLARTKEILETIYTEEIFFPIIDSMGERLKDEARIRASAIKADPEKAAQQLERNVKSLREHLTKRRKFLLEQEELRSAGKFLRAELK